MRKALLLTLLCWTVAGHGIRTIDGDTALMRLEIWPGITATERVRVLGVDTPEMRGPEQDQAQRARAFTAEWLSRGPVTVTSCGRDSLGRLLGRVKRGDDDLATALVNAGLGRVREKR